MLTPNNNIGEVTLIGTGGGYGESIVIHLGNQEWAVIDSCVNPNTKESLPLEYLKSINVDIANEVKLILISHWHDDHIKGISQLYNKAKNAELFISHVQDRSKFMAFVGFDYKKIDDDITAVSTYEFVKCIQILKERKPKIINKANADKRLWLTKITFSRLLIFTEIRKKN
jgi:glyoxylase-like metal-dependent hydrolase (beta-lactamase superfamily II)